MGRGDCVGDSYSHLRISHFDVSRHSLETVHEYCSERMTFSTIIDIV